MKNILEDIKEKLKKFQYTNEEQIRLSLVARILEKLGWNIWNPQEVYTEFSPNNERYKVDIALFANSITSPIYIEIKSAEKLSNHIELIKAENQLRDYNVNLTALFTILTDGNQWRFYYSQEGGTFSQKCFKVIELMCDDFEDIEIAFLSFLSKLEIINGNAKKEAYEYLQMSRKQQIMEESFANAKREQDDDPLLNLVDALCKAVYKRGLTINSDEAIEFLKADKNKKKTKTLTTEIAIKKTTNIISTRKSLEVL